MIEVSDTYGIIDKAQGVEIHVRIVKHNDETYADLREYIAPAEDEDQGHYAHGLIVPLELVPTLTAYMESAYVAQLDRLPTRKSA